MPFEVKVESENLLKQFEDMQTRVTGLYQKLPDVFLDWQRVDMHRKYPKVDAQANPLSVTTFVYPRSRKQRVRYQSSGKKTQRKAPRRVVGTARPILRPVLVTQLFDRMKRMCLEAIAWH